MSSRSRRKRELQSIIQCEPNGLLLCLNRLVESIERRDTTKLAALSAPLMQAVGNSNIRHQHGPLRWTDQGQYDHTRSTGRHVAIPATFFAPLKTRHRHTSVGRRIECFHHRLTSAANPAPVTHQGRASEQSELYRQAIETPHVPVGVDAAKMDRLGIECVHARSLASFRAAVQ